MTRFQADLQGFNGEYWQKDAEKELQKVKADLEAGRITIDNLGIAYNSIGRALMEDMAEKVAMITDRIDLLATQTAREEEIRIALQGYKPRVDTESLMDIVNVKVGVAALFGIFENAEDSASSVSKFLDGCFCFAVNGGGLFLFGFVRGCFVQPFSPYHLQVDFFKKVHRVDLRSIW